MCVPMLYARTTPRHLKSWIFLAEHGQRQRQLPAERGSLREASVHWEALSGGALRGGKVGGACLQAAELPGVGVPHGALHQVAVH